MKPMRRILIAFCMLRAVASLGWSQISKKKGGKNRWRIPAIRLIRMRRIDCGRPERRARECRRVRPACHAAQPRSVG